MVVVIYDVFRSAKTWPTFQYVSSQVWDEVEEDPRDLYYALSDRNLVRPRVARDRGFELRDDTQIALTLEGLERVQAHNELQTFVAVVRYVGTRAAGWRPSDPTQTEQLHIQSTEVQAAVGTEADERQLRLLHEYGSSMWTGLDGPGTSGCWGITVNAERARQFRDVSSVSDFASIDQRVRRPTGAPSGVATAARPGRAIPSVVLESAAGQETDPGFVEGWLDPQVDAGQAPRIVMKNRTLAALAKPFEGGGGPSHSTIDLIFSTADAAEYLGQGNKLNRVLGGLRTLRDGRPSAPQQASLPPDHEKLHAVASDLATRLLAMDLVAPDSIREALGEMDQMGAKEPVDTLAEPAHPAMRSHVEETTAAKSTQADEGVHVDDPRVVMVVHGQDGQAERAMFDWLRAIGLKPREWSQHLKATGHASPFIGQVLDRAFAQAQAVVVLFTPDEHVRLRKELGTSPPGWRLQSRPNVLFEAGMAFATHPKRSVLVVLGAQELPSDLAGRHYVRLGTPSALRDLAQRLEGAGCPVDLSGGGWLDDTRFPDRSGTAAVP